MTTSQSYTRKFDSGIEWTVNYNDVIADFTDYFECDSKRNTGIGSFMVKRGHVTDLSMNVEQLIYKVLLNKDKLQNWVDNNNIKPNFPKFLDFGICIDDIDKKSSYTWLILNRFFTNVKIEFSLKNISPTWKIFINITRDLLLALKFLHKNHYAHGNICPSNIWIKNKGTPDDNTIYFLAGFNKTHRLETWNFNQLNSVNLVKSIEIDFASFASRDDHCGNLPSYRADLESLLYTLIYIYNKNIPWHNSTSLDVIYELKCKLWEDTDAFLDTCLGSLNINVLNIFKRFASYIKSLDYDQIPDYDHLTNVFNNEKSQYVDNYLETLNVSLEKPDYENSYFSQHTADVLYTVVKVLGDRTIPPTSVGE